MKSRIAILFQNNVTEGQIQINNGNLTDLKSSCGCDTEESRFCLCGDGPYRLEATFDDVKNDAGAYATRTSVKTAFFGFTFFLRDVNSNNPIYIPQYGIAVTSADDLRTYTEIADAVSCSAGMSELEKIAAAPEATYENSLQGLRKLDSPTWLGLARDIRIFEVGIRDYCAESWDSVSPKFFSIPEKLPELGESPVKYCFMAGRGIGCEKNITRRLEDGVLPIVNATNRDARANA
ncbi:MAG: hypothetical protein SCM11_10100 [Bacillota bacterium]|nr:hypothetical protein [Bacillota bacterium]